MPEIRKGDILFIEDSLKDACTIERTFSLLKLAGVFDKIGGILLGFLLFPKRANPSSLHSCWNVGNLFERADHPER